MPAPASVGAIERMLKAPESRRDSRAVRSMVLDEIRRHVSFDSYAWLLTDPETEVGWAPLADVPCLPELPRLIRLKYATSLHRWTELPDPVGLLHQSTEGHPERSLVWREMLAGYGVSDVASVVFRDRHGCWGFLDLWRIGGEVPFSAADAGFLASVAPTVTGALRGFQAAAFSEDAPGPRADGPAVLLLSPDLEVRAQTRVTEEYLRLLLPPQGDGQPIPANAYNVAAQLLAQEAGADRHAALARSHLSGGVWLSLRAARLGDAPRDRPSDIAVTIEAASPTDRMSVFTRAHALTARETELLGHLLTGSDTRTIATRMFVSENTVQDHLKSIFTKTGAASRKSLVARVAGQ